MRRVMRPALGVAVITPVVLAGAVAASPGSVPQAAPADPAAQSAGAQAGPQGLSVVAMAKPPANFRFAASTGLGPPPPAAVINSGGGMRIPAMALAAYRKAEQTMAVAAPNCGISWNLLAGIGRIESSHANGGATDARGTAIRPIYGPVLDGTLPGNEIIVQSNAGGRATYARAMGPMQFLPGTWSRYASDGDGDGRADPQNIFDASLAAARYLCSGGLNLRNQAQTLTAILRYNNSMAYAENVLGWAGAYATGVAPVDLPPITGPVPALGDAHLESKPEGLGPELQDMHGMPVNGDPLTTLITMGTLNNTESAAQLMPGPGALPSEHGCEVICMASQLAPSAVPAAGNLPPWMAPPGAAPWVPPWMAPPPAEGPAPLGVPPGPSGLPPGPAGAAPGPVGLPPGPAAVSPVPAAEAPVLAGAPAPDTPPAPPAPGPEPVVAAEVTPTLPMGPGPLPGPAS